MRFTRPSDFSSQCLLQPNEDVAPNKGKYNNGIIVATYTVGGLVDIDVKITAYHKGYFEFRYVCALI